MEMNKPPCLLQYRGQRNPQECLMLLNKPGQVGGKTACAPCSGGPGRGSVALSPCYSSEDVISCQLTRSVQCAHQKPITVLRAAAGRVVTGSQDHTVRVRTPTGVVGRGAGQERPPLLLLLPFQIYRLEDSCCLFTLQGHSGGITAIYIDQVSGPFHNDTRISSDVEVAFSLLVPTDDGSGQWRARWRHLPVGRADGQPRQPRLRAPRRRHLPGLHHFLRHQLRVGRPHLHLGPEHRDQTVLHTAGTPGTASQRRICWF